MYVIFLIDFWAMTTWLLVITFFNPTTCSVTSTTWKSLRDVQMWTGYGVTEDSNIQSVQCVFAFCVCCTSLCVCGGYYACTCRWWLLNELYLVTSRTKLCTWKNLDTVYVKIFAWQNFCQPQIPLYCRNIWGNKFRQCSEGHHILYVIINTGQKNLCGKISPMRADGEIGKNFLLAKISAYTVCTSMLSYTQFHYFFLNL